MTGSYAVEGSRAGAGLAGGSCLLPVLASVVVNMEFNQAPLVDVFQILGQLGGCVLVDPAVTGEVSTY